MAAIVEVDFVIEAGNYVSNIENLRAKLADHPDPEYVKGHPVLPKQLLPKKPARWIHINISTGAHKASILAVRDDNVYLIGFKAQSERWYEFGFDDSSAHLIEGSTFLECGPKYKDLVGGNDSQQVRAKLVNLQLGKSVAEEAVIQLSGYKQPKPPGGGPDDATKLGLARLILIICESARMTSISNTVSKGWTSVGGIKISSQQVDYLWNWGPMSGAVLEKEKNPGYKWPAKLKKIGIKNQDDALHVVYLILNTKPPKQAPPAPKAADEDDDDDTEWHMHAAANNDGLGRPLVEVFSVRAGFPVIGTIAVFDGICGQIIYKKQDHRMQTTLEGDMVLTGPHAAISADGSFVIKVDLDSASGEHSITDNNAGGELFWNCYDDDAAYNAPLTCAISTARGPVEVTYAVLANAVEATVQVRLLLSAQPAAGALIHGKVTARSKAFGVPSVLFSHDSEDKVPFGGAAAADDSMIIPLSRSVVAVPLHSPLEVEATFHTPGGANNGIVVGGKFVFYPELHGDHVKSEFTEHGEIQVKVTWSDI